MLSISQTLFKVLESCSAVSLGATNCHSLVFLFEYCYNHSTASTASMAQSMQWTLDYLINRFRIRNSHILYWCTTFLSLINPKLCRRNHNVRHPCSTPIPYRPVKTYACCLCNTYFFIMFPDSSADKRIAISNNGKNFRLCCQTWEDFPVCGYKDPFTRDKKTSERESDLTSLSSNVGAGFFFSHTLCTFMP